MINFNILRYLTPILLLPTLSLAASFTYNVAYDGANRVTSVKVDNKNSATYTYRKNGQLLKVALAGSGGSLPPGQVLLIAPVGTTIKNQPTYIWNAVQTATWYYLWVNDSSKTRFTKWYRASEVGCGDGTGACLVKSGISLAKGDYTWWIKTWNSNGHGPWSSGMSFTGSGRPPVAATLVSPTGTIKDNTPSYIWNAVSNATWYYLWVNEGTKKKFAKWYKASDAGCSDGTGECKVTPSTSLVNGQHKWWIQT